MKTDANFLKPPDLKTYMGRLKESVHPSPRLPQNVFAEHIHVFHFFEFDVMLTPAFWNLLRSVAPELNLNAIVMAVLDPDPINYYAREFGYCSAFELATTATEDDYFAALSLIPDESPADAVLYNSNVVVWAPNNDSWAAWGERDKGIGILGLGRPCILSPLLKDMTVSKSTAAQFLADSLSSSGFDPGTAFEQFCMAYGD